MVPSGPYACGFAAETTNQRMELQAVLEALRTLDGPVEVMSDSTYVVNCFRDGWYRSWLRKGWRNSARKPVANRDLWEPLVGLYLDRSDEISLRWVKGHGGDQWNEAADQLAVEAALTGRSSSGLTPPESVAPQLF